MYQDLKNKIVELLDGLEYEKILLFGSRARGESRINSDYDVIVTLIKNITREEKFKIQSKIRKAFAEERIDIDIIVKNLDEYDYLKTRIGNVIYYANKEGVLL